MHSRYLFTYLFSLALTLSWSGTPIYNTVFVDDEFPEVGQTVTFTLGSFVSSCSNGACIYPEPTSACIPINMSVPINYTYNAPGNYTVELHCNPATGGAFQKEVTNKFLAALPLQLRNSSGTLVPGNNIIVSAASTNASSIPTLGEWSLIILGLIILGIGLVSMRENRVGTITK